MAKYITPYMPFPVDYQCLSKLRGSQTLVIKETHCYYSSKTIFTASLSFSLVTAL